MPYPAQPHQSRAADARLVVLGVDTHKHAHAAAVLTVVGTLLGSRSLPATAAGYQQMLAWAGSFGQVMRAGVECTGSYGAGLARYLHRAGVSVVEVNQPDKATRRRRGKNDATDAEMAAAAVLSGRARALPKAGDGPVEAMRVFKLAKASAVKARTQAINQLKALLVTADPARREPLAPLPTKALVRACAELTEPTGACPATAATVYALRCLAHRIHVLATEIADLERRITDTVTAHTPGCCTSSASPATARPPC